MKKSVVILLHIACWVILLTGMNVFKTLAAYFLTLKDTGNFLLYLNFTIFVWFYTSYFGLFKLLRYKKVLSGISALFVATAILLYFTNPSGLGYYLLTLSVMIPWCFMGLLFRIFIDWNQKDKERLHLSRQNLKSELALLRTQINPHFLFNSLHNIDTLISVNPAKASDSLLKLSDMMRYMLYEADTEMIELSRETEYLRQYISLQELRISNPELVRLETDLQAEPVKIAPMLFIPFIENAFKHTTDKNTRYGISILIKQKENHICFEIVNIFDASKKIIKDPTKGIGLNNVKRRLELIYPGRYQLDIRQEGNFYKVNLDIRTNA